MQYDAHQTVALRAIVDGKENQRVIACAGAGKTAVLTGAIAELVEGGMAPSAIVATTFTRKAGAELQSRVAALIGNRAADLRMGTFHGLALRHLATLPGAERWSMRRCIDVGGKDKEVPSASWLMTCICGYQEIPGLNRPGLNLKDEDDCPQPRAYSSAIDLLRSEGIDYGTPKARQVLAERKAILPPRFSEVWGLYEGAKSALKGFDFADVLAAWLRAVQAGTPGGAGYPALVLVDEAQDNSWIQLTLAAALASKGRLILVGDTRQAIYEWRGAAPEILRNHESPAAFMPNNYRSGALIVEAGNRIAADQPWSLGPASVPMRALKGAVVALPMGVTREETAELVADELLTRGRVGSYSDCAILVRTNAAAAAYEVACVRRKIPVVLVGNSIFEDQAVQIMLAYVALIQHDSVKALGKVINKPTRYLGAAFTKAVEGALKGRTLPDAIDAAAMTAARGQGARTKAKGLAQWLCDLRARAANAPHWSDALAEIIKLLTPAQASALAEGDDDPAAIKYASIASIARSFDSVAELLHFVDRCRNETIVVRPEDPLPPGRVTISTIHRAKGLEWATVILEAAASTLPHPRAGEDGEAGERRLAYVAVTRARDTLLVAAFERDERGAVAGPSPYTDLILAA